MSPKMLNSLGVLLQVLAAAYLVLQAYRTSQTLGNLPRTYDTIGGSIERALGEVSSQFGHQLIAFAVLAMGSALQLAAEWL